MAKSDMLQKIQAKMEQSWQIAANDSCNRRTHVLAEINREITALFCEMEQTITE